MIRLSPEQRAAVAVRSGPVRVIAGAGTGKTAVIAERFADLVRHGAKPESILVMTFTERAAAEMRTRIEARAGVEVGSTQVGTFHAVAQAWLRDDGRRVGVPQGHRILTGAERWILARELMWELGDRVLVGVERPDDLVTPLLKVLERLKQELVGYPRLERWAAAEGAEAEETPLLVAAVRLFRAYDAACRRDRLLDFDDLLQRSVRLLEEFPAVRDRYARRYPWLLVDEYQDTNLAQERLVELLAGPGGNVCVVGDDDQSIYRFRGASRASMERFAASFPGARTRVLTRNRRSTRNIVAASQGLIAGNPGRLPKELTSVALRGEPVAIWACPDGRSEAAAIAREIEVLLASGVPPAQVAVLVRTNALAKPLMDALVAAGIRHRWHGAQGFYGRPEVRDLIALLRLISNPRDVGPLARLGPAQVEAGHRVALLERMAAISGAGGDPLDALGASDFATAVRELGELKSKLGVEELFFEAMTRTGYVEGLQDRPEPERAQATAAVSRFAELISEYCERTPDQSLDAYLAHVDLVLLSGQDEDLGAEAADPDEVSVMTIHRAKGLEFDVVFVPSMVEGRLPQPPRQERLRLPPAILEPAVRGREDHLAEERRLCYVAMTRARRRLYLSWAPAYEGDRTWRRSRFLAEIVAVGGPVVREVEPAAAPDLDGGTGERSWLPLPQPRPSPGVSEEPVVLSFSSVASYRECPRQHWYRYRLRLPAQPAAEAEFGSILHRALMAAGRRRREGAALTEAGLRAEYEAAWSEAAFPDPRREKTFRGLGWEMLLAYWNGGGLDAAPLLVEEPFTTAIDGVGLRGTIDRVDRVTPPAAREGGAAGTARESQTTDQAPVYRLIDYKSGAAMPAGRLRRDLQLALYALAVRSALGLEPIELEIVYLRENKTVRLEAGDDLLGQAAAALREVEAGVRAGHFEPRPERRRCRLCAYRMSCPDSL